MSDTVIKVENLSKQYRLGEVGTGSMKDDIKRWRYKMMGLQDPFLKLGEENDRTVKSKSKYVWALRDINFEVKQGEILGIIGKNGAGKSTLLKILSRTTGPTIGSVKMKGRIASLLEVGTGFHGELSGRDNIFLNGAIMGMTKSEIKSKLDEIIDFAGVEKYIDTPVKRYSSGMYVRLAFGVAAHLEPDIMIVDEVLAVGDAEFQKKALGKMKDVSTKDGRTVLFVSHNLAAVKSLCTKAMILENGNKKYVGDTGVAVSHYLKNNSVSMNRKKFNLTFDHPLFCLHEISLNPKGKSSDDILDEYQEIELHSILTLKEKGDLLHFTYVLNNENGDPLFTFSHINSGKKLKDGLNHITCTFPKGYLNVGTYYLSVYLIQNAKAAIFNENDIMSFSIQEGQRAIGSWMGKEPGFIKPSFEWEINNSL